MIEREPEFDDQDRALILAHAQIEAETTENGFKWWEEVSYDAHPMNPDRKFEFVALEPQTNHVVRARERARRQMREIPGFRDEDMDGMVWPVVKRDITP